MVDVSLMPPVDYCASCEGRKAESRALDIASARERKALESAQSVGNEGLSPGALPSISAVNNEAASVSTITKPLIAPDLAVQASLAGSEIPPTESGVDPTARLLAQQAYSAANV